MNGKTDAAGRAGRRAELALRRQIFISTSEEERIADFIKNNPPGAERTVEEWMEIHQKLTGSCGIGGYRFIRDRGLKRYERKTTLEFLEAVDGVYGGDVIEKIRKHYKEDEG